MNTLLKVIIGLIIFLFVIVPILLLIFFGIFAKKIIDEGVCYTTDNNGRGCTLGVKNKDCKGKHFNTMDECQKYMNKNGKFN